MSEAANQNTNEKPPTTGQTEQEEPIKPPEATLVTLTKTDHKLEDGDATPTTEASNQEAEEANTAKPKQKSNKRKRKETGTKEEHPAKKQRTVKSKSSGEYDPTLWTTKDDLLLKEMVLNTLDITKVAKSTKFSKNLHKQRWKQGGKLCFMTLTLPATRQKKWRNFLHCINEFCGHLWKKSF